MSLVDDETGNAILVCRKCGGKTDKGCPPIDGQDDRTYKCEDCQKAENKTAFAAVIPTEDIQGS